MNPNRDQYDLEILIAYDEAQRTIPIEAVTRLDRALMIALTGVILNKNDHHKVASQTKAEIEYRVTKYDCECQDRRAPIIDGAKLCKHQLAVRLSVTAGAMYRLWQSECLELPADPMPSDLQRLTVLGTQSFGTTAHIIRKDKHQVYRDVNTASLIRIQDLCQKAQRSKCWTTRPFSLASVGWVLERADGRD